MIGANLAPFVIGVGGIVGQGEAKSNPAPCCGLHVASGGHPPGWSAPPASGRPGHQSAGCWWVQKVRRRSWRVSAKTRALNQAGDQVRQTIRVDRTVQPLAASDGVPCNTVSLISTKSPSQPVFVPAGPLLPHLDRESW